MANHGRQGVDLDQYLARKLRPHVVSGLFVSDGSQSKPQSMCRRARIVTLQRRGNGRRAGKSGEAPKASGSVVHYYPVRCSGRPNASDARREDRRAVAIPKGTP